MIYRAIHLKMSNISEKVAEKLKKNIFKNFLPKIISFMRQPGWPKVPILRKRIASWIPKAKTHTLK
jgi:hypothetical protein